MDTNMKLFIIEHPLSLCYSVHVPGILFQTLLV